MIIIFYLIPVLLVGAFVGLTVWGNHHCKQLNVNFADFYFGNKKYEKALLKYTKEFKNGKKA